MKRGAFHLFLTLGLVVGVLASVAPAAQAAGATRRVTISKLQTPTGSGAGGLVTSRSNPTQTTQLNCGTTCTVAYSRYATVTIVATPDANSTLVGFGTGCTRSTTNTNECTIGSLASDTTITVTFARKQALSVTKASTEGGGGAVAASGATAFSDCATAPCTSTSNEIYNSAISLTATADATSKFMNWTGCNSTSGVSGQICSVTMSGAKSVTANFRKTYALSATKASTGTGAGTLTAAGTTCAPTCTSRSISSESVTLVASPSAGSVFSGWEGNVGTCTTATTCTLLMDRDRTNVAARFTSLETLTVTLDGSGSLTSSPAGTTGSIVDCTTTCSATFPYGTSVTLTASSPESARFGGWLGCTSATASCSVTVTGATSVTATFGDLNKLQVTTTATGGGGATGEVTASGIDCGTDCYEWYDPDTEVVLTASPDAGSRFGSWTGPCAETDLTTTTCTVTMSATSSVTADFVKVWDLTLGAVAAGSPAYGGSVAAGSLTIGCTGDGCGPSSSSGSVTYDHDTAVTLIADPDTDTFVTWSGDIGTCDPNALECVVTMDQARTVTATFAQIEYDVTVTIAGSGEEFGSVVSDPAGIDCPTDCSGSFAIHATVELTAVAASGARFDAWTGPCTEDVLTGDTCTVKVEDAVEVTATFVALHDLTVVVDPGDGGGSVASDVGGIDCGPSCVETYDEGDDITLTATPDLDSRIISWSGGGCSGDGATCDIADIAAATTVTVTFAKKIFTLGVTPIGTGSITSSVGDIDCGSGSVCSDEYLIDTEVTLSAVYDPAAVRFDGWGGACAAADTSTCTVTVTGTTSVTATFVTIWALSVTAADDGTGTGTVTSTDGIDCGDDCTETYDTGTTVVLQANPGADSMVASWSGGGCSGTGATCTVSMTQAQAVTVTFTKLVYPLTVTKSSVGGGSGTVAIAADSYVCDAACTTFTRNYDPGTSVTLSQTPSTGSWFVGWGGACASAGTAATCTVSVDAATSVSATFETMPVLTVAKAGIGSGTVTWTDPVGGDHIDCGLDCRTAVITNTVITLVATPLASNGSTVAGWSIRACGTALTCDVTMSASTTVTVTFTAPAAYVSLSKTSQYSGSGTVVSQPASISCAASCTKTQTGTYANFATVVLVATPSSDSYIVGWSAGSCDEVSADLTRCTVTLGAAGTTRAVNVTFSRPQLSLSKSSISQGRGSVSGPNLNCGNTCNSRTVVYTPGQSVTLTATPASGSIFVRWAGDGSCTGTLPTCTVTMDRARNVIAVFGQGVLLSVVKTGGSGLVYWAGNSSALQCGDVCATAVASGTTVTLVASPDAGYVFVRWEGAACADPLDQYCTISVTSATTATAVFAPEPLL